MGTRFKRLLHRGKKDAVSREPYVQGGEPELPALPYESTVAANRPISGSYPIKGRISSRSSFEHGDPHASQQRPRRLSWKRRSRVSLPDTTNSSQPAGSTIIPVRNTSNSVHTEDSPPAIRPSSQALPNNGFQAPSSLSKETHNANHRSTSWHVRQSPSPDMYQTTSVPSKPPHSRSPERFQASQAPRKLPSRSPERYDAPTVARKPVPSGQSVVDRANFNSDDTDVTEHIAPAVTHETVINEIHHVREEKITREFHEHDVFHRILPVVDVEVLPARHFLPTEGGGLVEVNADEVPGRRRNWVIAETVSEIPSNQTAPQGRRHFSAREFRGTEGDAQKYRAPNGHVRTEQTWVHPPELETGAKITGQSWPMEFGNLSLNDRDEGKNKPLPQSPKGKKKRRDHGRGQVV